MGGSSEDWNTSGMEPLYAKYEGTPDDDFNVIRGPRYKHCITWYFNMILQWNNFGLQYEQEQKISKLLYLKTSHRIKELIFIVHSIAIDL